MGFRGGGANLTPPVFKYPSRDRVKSILQCSPDCKDQGTPSCRPCTSCTGKYWTGSPVRVYSFNTSQLRDCFFSRISCKIPHSFASFRKIHVRHKNEKFSAKISELQKKIIVIFRIFCESFLSLVVMNVPPSSDINKLMEVWLQKLRIFLPHYFSVIQILSTENKQTYRLH